MIPTATDPVGTLVFFVLVFAGVGVFFLFIHLVDRQGHPPRASRTPRS